MKIKPRFLKNFSLSLSVFFFFPSFSRHVRNWKLTNKNNNVVNRMGKMFFIFSKKKKKREREREKRERERERRREGERERRREGERERRLGSRT